MVSIYKAEKMRRVGNEKRTVMELRGLSTDTKPVDKINGTYIDNGSVFVEINTGKIYMFDLENTDWKEI